MQKCPQAALKAFPLINFAQSPFHCVHKAFRLSVGLGIKSCCRQMLYTILGTKIAEQVTRKLGAIVGHYCFWQPETREALS
jgi:hypothetical protein